VIELALQPYFRINKTEFIPGERIEVKVGVKPETREDRYKYVRFVVTIAGKTYSTSGVVAYGKAYTVTPEVPRTPGTYEVTARIYLRDSSGNYSILLKEYKAEFTVKEPPPTYTPTKLYIEKEESTVDINGYTATIHGKVTIAAPSNDIVYPVVAYMGGKILLDPIKIYEGTRTYTYTRTFNFKSVYELLRRRGETTDAYIWYYKSDKTTKIQGDATKFKLEPTGVITPKAVVKITVDKTQIMRGESITGTATIEKVEGIKLPTTATLCLDGEAYLKDGRKPGFGTAPFFSQTISSVPVSTKFSFNPTRVRGLENAVKVDLRVRAVIGGYEFKSNTVTITIVEPKVTGWSAKVDKTTVKPGDKLTIQATVNWVGKSMKFKLGIDAFGKHYESTEVTATASPATIKVPITVPAVKEGTYEIKVTLYRE